MEKFSIKPEKRLENMRPEFWSHKSPASEFVFPSGILRSSFSR